MVLFAVLTVAMGCSQGTPYAAPSFAFRPSYLAARAGEPVLLTNIEWWKRFQDPVLDALVERALSGNLDIATARERVIEAAAARRAVPAAASLTPDIGVRREGGDGAADQTVNEGNLIFTWLLDPYGARRDQLRGADARVAVAEAEVASAQLMLLFTLGNAYVDLRYRQRLLALRHQEIASRRKTLALTQTFFDANSATRLDIVRSQARVAEIEAQLPALKAAIRNQQAEIAVLTGVAPGNLPINLDVGPVQPRARLAADVGIPADLLRNRPDIRIAERLYYAAIAEIGVARAELYPRLSLGGAITLSQIRGPSQTEYYFGPTLRFPALLSKTPGATVKARESQARQAHTAWKSTVLDAILQVESSLVDYSAASAGVRAAEKTVRLYREVVTLTEDLITRDGATLRDLLDAEESIADADTALAESLRLQARSFVALNVNLGSGNGYPARVAGVSN